MFPFSLKWHVKKRHSKPVIHQSTTIKTKFRGKKKFFFNLPDFCHNTVQHLTNTVVTGDINRVYLSHNELLFCRLRIPEQDPKYDYATTNISE